MVRVVEGIEMRRQEPQQDEKDGLAMEELQERGERITSKSQGRGL
jgi:hypothetical protein